MRKKLNVFKYIQISEMRITYIIYISDNSSHLGSYIHIISVIYDQQIICPTH